MQQKSTIYHSWMDVSWGLLRGDFFCLSGDDKIAATKTMPFQRRVTNQISKKHNKKYGKIEEKHDEKNDFFSHSIKEIRMNILFRMEKIVRSSNCIKGDCNQSKLFEHRNNEIK